MHSRHTVWVKAPDSGEKGVIFLKGGQRVKKGGLASTNVRPAGKRRRQLPRPHCLSVFTPPPPPQCCATLTFSPLSHSRRRRRSEPLQPAMKTLTHRLARRKEKKMLSMMRRSVPCEEEAFIHLFCLFSKTNRGQGYAATLIALCLLQLNFKLGVLRCPLFWSLQSLPAAFQAPW